MINLWLIVCKSPYYQMSIGQRQDWTSHQIYSVGWIDMLYYYSVFSIDSHSSYSTTKDGSNAWKLLKSINIYPVSVSYKPQCWYLWTSQVMPKFDQVSIMQFYHVVSCRSGNQSRWIYATTDAKKWLQWQHQFLQKGCWSTLKLLNQNFRFTVTIWLYW